MARSGGGSLMHAVYVACVVAGVVASLATARATDGTPGPYINLTQSSYAGPGIGFDFSIADNGTAVQAGAALAAKLLPLCTQEGLDVEYFYVYGCVVPTSFVRQLAAAVPGFQFASDKSITTRVPKSADDLLIANAWNLTLVYGGGSDGAGAGREAAVSSAAAACKADARRAMGGEGCVVSAACASAAGGMGASDNTKHGREHGRDGGPGTAGGTITVGCGSLTCVGCVLPGFWSQFGFTSAHFDVNQAEAGENAARAVVNGDDRAVSPTAGTAQLMRRRESARALLAVAHQNTNCLLAVGVARIQFGFARCSSSWASRGTRLLDAVVDCVWWERGSVVFGRWQRHDRVVMEEAKGTEGAAGAGAGASGSGSGETADPTRLLQMGWWSTEEGRALLVALRKQRQGLLVQHLDEVSALGTVFAKVTVKVVLRGKQGAGKSSLISACCSDPRLTDEYMKSVGLQVRSCLWPIKTVGERVFATNFEFWDANEQAQKTVGHFKAQTVDGMDVVVHVVSLRDKFFPLALERQMKQDNAAGGSGQAAPAHVVVVTKGDADALSSRVTAFQAVSEWAHAKGVPCVAACPTLAARRAAHFSVASVVHDVATVMDTIAAAALARTLAAKAAASMGGALAAGSATTNRFRMLARKATRGGSS